MTTIIPQVAARRLDTLRRLVNGNPDAARDIYQACSGDETKLSKAINCYNVLATAFAKATDLTRQEVAELLDGAVK
jgi:hypothetical protein